LFSSRRKEKEKEKETKGRKKNAKKGGSLPSSSHSALSLVAPTCGLLFLPFRFKHFLFGIFFLRRRKERKPQRRKKMQRREGIYLSSGAFAFGMKRSSCFLLSTFLQQ
jgi:hypothetical protein